VLLKSVTLRRLDNYVLLVIGWIDYQPEILLSVQFCEI
jgi:hypothetical protein